MTSPEYPDMAVLLVDAAPLARPFTRNDALTPQTSPAFLDCDALSARLGLPVVAMWAIASDCGEGSRPGLDTSRNDDARAMLAHLREMFADAPDGVVTNEQLAAWSRQQLQKIRALVDATEAAIRSSAPDRFPEDLWTEARALASSTTMFADQVGEYALSDRAPNSDDAP
jgi:hypothetical protein